MQFLTAFKVRDSHLQWRTVEDLEGEVGTLAGPVSLSWPVLRLVWEDRTVPASLSWRLLCEDLTGPFLLMEENFELELTLEGLGPASAANC